MISRSERDGARVLASMPWFVERVYGSAPYHADAEVVAAAFAADGTIWSVEDSGVLRQWRPNGQPAARHFLSDTELVWAFSGDAAWLASGHERVMLWRPADGRLQWGSAGVPWVTALGFGPGAAWLVSGHDDGSVRVWDTASGQCRGVFSVAAAPVSAVAVAPDGQTLAVAAEDRVIRLLELGSGRVMQELHSHTDRIPAVAWSPDGTWLYSAGWDTSARVWRPPHPEPLMLLNSHAEQVLVLACSPQGVLACADSDHQIFLWTDPAHAGQGPILRGHSDEIRCLAFDAAGRKLVSAGADRVLMVWDVASGQAVTTPHGETVGGYPHAEQRHPIAVIPGKPERLVSVYEGEARVWQTADGSAGTPQHAAKAYSVAASTDGRWLAIGGCDHLTHLYDLAHAAPPVLLEATKPPIGRLAFAADGRRLAHTSPADGLVWIWDCASGQPELILIEAADGCTLETLTFHPDGQRLAVGGIDYLATGNRAGALVVWDLDSRQQVYIVEAGVVAAAFDPHGRYLAAATLDGSIFLCHADTGRQIEQLPGHAQRVRDLAFDPAGRFLVSCGDDACIRVWDGHARRLRTIHELDTVPCSLSFDGDGQRLYVGLANGSCLRIAFAAWVAD